VTKHAVLCKHWNPMYDISNNGIQITDAIVKEVSSDANSILFDQPTAAFRTACKRSCPNLEEQQAFVRCDRTCATRSSTAANCARAFCTLDVNGSRSKTRGDIAWLRRDETWQFLVCLRQATLGLTALAPTG